MKQEEYLKALFLKVNENNEILCEDCGALNKLGHFIIDHTENIVKAVCHSCFVTKYQAGLYGKEYRA